MEIVLLWLDDLDDIVFTAALAWERLRRTLLKIGLAAAFALPACELSAMAASLIPTFTIVATGCVSAWLLGAAFRLAYSRDLTAIHRAA